LIHGSNWKRTRIVCELVSFNLLLMSGLGGFMTYQGVTTGWKPKRADIYPFARGLVFFFFICAYHCQVTAATLPSGFTENLVANGLSRPTAMDFSPDGRLFVCLQGGQLRVIKNGTLLATPFITLNVDSNGERGLLGVAFDPNFAANNFIYLYYTVPGATAHNRLSRFTANGDVAAAGSESILLELNNLSSATNHNGGAIHFGPDGKLYIAVGENANGANSQTLDNLLGKMLRINSDGTIPSDNPFFNTATGNNRAIWALGLRNPFTFAFQPGSTRMFINDVGQNTWEEINDGIAGSNYGWPTTEGATSNPNFRSPLFVYGHGISSTTGCAIVGGGFYNPAIIQFPTNFVGKYFFADLCSGWVRLFDPANNTASDFASGISQPVDLKIASDGSLYYASIGSASVFRIQFTGGTAPSITGHPSNQTVLQGQPATFTVTAAGSTPLSYQWQRNQVNIPGANGPSHFIAGTTIADNGATFRCVVTNTFGSATSNEATLTVNAPPSITGHPSSQTVTQGQAATFGVTAAGTAPLSFQWQRNQANISGATNSSYTISSAALSDNGAKFRCVVTNPFGSAASNEATLTVQPPPPVLFTEEGSDSAISFASVARFRDPFSLIDTFNFSADGRTRLLFFGANLDLLPAETITAVTARAEDAQMNVYPLAVEFMGQVPGQEWLTQLIVRLPDNLPTGQSVLVSVTLHGQTSNKVRIRMR
jgi:glucose/arabinose dehydrogenase